MKFFSRKDLSSNLFLLILVMFLIGIGGAFVARTWNVSQKSTKEYAKQMAAAASYGFQGSVLNQITNGAELPENSELSQSLNGLNEKINGVISAYIYKQDNGRLYLVAKSGSLNGEKVFNNEDFLAPFKTGEVFVTNEYSDSSGSWISVLNPIKNDSTGETVAVLGLDFPANLWNNQSIINTLLSTFLVLSIIFIAISHFFILRQKTRLRQEKQLLQQTDIKLKKSETLFRTIFNQAPVGVSIGQEYGFISIDDDMPCVNPMFEKITGRSKEELSNTTWVDITHPDDLDEDLENFKKFKAGEIDTYKMEKRYLRPDGSIVWIRLTVAPLRLEGDNSVSHLSIIEDISKQKEIEQALRDSERSKSVLLDNLPGMAYRCKLDRDWTMLFVSQGCYELTGYSRDDLLNNNKLSFNDLILPKYRETLWEKWIEAIKNHSKFQEEYEIITASGERKWVWEQGQAIYDENGEVVALEGLLIDITRRKIQEIKEKYYNHHDYITGLHNRRFFVETLNQELQNKHEKKAVLLVNLRRFSTITLNYGYRFSENLIKQLAKRLSTLCDERLSLYQLSIDRFIFYIKNYKDAAELNEICQNILEIFDSVIANRAIGYNIGVVEIDPYKDNSVESIIKNASIVVETIGERQMVGYGFFNREMEASLMRETMIANELACLAKGEENAALYLMYQPIISLKTDTICGFEALARLQIDHLGLIPPQEFVPIAEKTQLIIPLGIRIMRQALLFLKQLENEGHKNLRVSVNISAIQLLSHDFLPDLAKLLEETEVNPNNVCLELTETVFSDYAIINEKLEKVKEFGIKVSIDDFGTGYSTLARERELNIDLIKIDKYFLDKLTLDCQSSITGDIISMAHKQGHEVVAEGVENEMQKQYLIENNCDYMQGYYFCRPISMETTLEMLNNDNLSYPQNIQ